MNWLKQQVAHVAGTAEPIYGPSALRSVAVQANETPYTELTKDELRWTLMDSTSVETQTFYITADDGHLGMVQLIYSNVAGIRTACQFNSKIIYPDRSRPHLWTSDPLEHYTFDAGRWNMTADNCRLELNEKGDTFHITASVNARTKVDVTFRRLAPGFHVGKDGSSYFGTDSAKPWGSMRHRFWPRCAVEGGITTSEGHVNFTGKGLFIHALQGMKPHHAAAKWDFVDFQGPTHSAIMMSFTTPPSYGSSVVNVSGIATDDSLVLANGSGSAAHTATRDDPDWPEPAAVRFEWTGSTAEGQPASAVLEGPLNKRLDKVDVMAEVPGFVKTIVGGVVGTRPFIFQFSPDPPLELRLNIAGKESVEKGTLFMESTFISGD